MRPCNFFYNVSGEEAERLLHEYGTDGDFLARPSESQPTNFTLSVIRGALITHVKIENNGDSLVIPSAKEPFGSLAELVEHCIQNPDVLREKNGATIVLRNPVSVPPTEPAARDVRASAAQKWFHINMTAEEAATRLAKEKQWTFLVRESQRVPGNYVITVKSADTTSHIRIQRIPQSGKYHVGGGDEFDSVQELLDHYNSNPLVAEQSQRVVHLMHLIPSTCIPANAVKDRISLLSQETSPKRTGFAEEFERMNEPDDLSSKRCGKKEQNVPKNRYKNIVPFDHTRVVLRDEAQPKDPRDTDYINANYIRIPPGPPLYLESSRKYISTQGCIENTVVDFWRMVWQENSRIIVMTTREVEKSKNLCYKYWPALQAEQNFRGYYVKTVEETVFHDAKQEEIYIKRRFMVSRCGKPLREIFHMQFVGWPDHGSPDDPEAFLGFLATYNEIYQRAPSNQGPVIVHCSAGLGRTGTFIIIDILLNTIGNKGLSCTIDIPGTVMCIRRQRGGLVQMLQQYMFIYNAVDCYVVQQQNRSPSSRREEIGPNNGNTPTPPPIPHRQRAYISSNH